MKLVLYMGRTSVGKSYALRNLPAEQTYIIRPNSKPPVMKGWKSKYVPGKNLITTNKLDKIRALVHTISAKKLTAKYIVLEDFTHFFNARIFSDTFMDMNSGNEAFQRWNEFGASVFQALFDDIDLREDLTLIVIHHTEVKETGDISFKSSGKLLDNTIEFDSYFTYVLHGFTTTTDSGTEYKIYTNTVGSHIAKTPPGCFEDSVVDNDLLPILEKINNYEK